MELEKLGQFLDDEEALKEVQAIKHQNKKILKEYLKRTQEIEIDDHSIFDIQVKRLHEYKRQQIGFDTLARIGYFVCGRCLCLL